MADNQIIQQVVACRPPAISARGRALLWLLVALGAAGLILGFFSSRPASGWVAIWVSTAMLIGLGIVGVLFSAIFEMTNAKWGRSYKRLLECSVVLGPLGLAGLLAGIFGAGQYFPWVHAGQLHGGNRIWLSRPFWDLRVLFFLLLTYAVGLGFLYFSWRRDFCLAAVKQTFQNRLAQWLGSNIANPEEESTRCKKWLDRLAPLLAIVYSLCFSFLGIDLIMALEPQWVSTLFGAWYFMGHLFAGLALLALVSMFYRKAAALQGFFSDRRQKDLGTLLFALCLVNIDFFWSQYLTIWYGNLPEETGYLVTRTVDANLPWTNLSWASIIAFFFIPFGALLFQKVKLSKLGLSLVSLVVIAGIFLDRFIEIAPPLLAIPAGAGFSQTLLVPLLASVLVFVGCLGAGALLYSRLLRLLPFMPVGDELFWREQESNSVQGESGGGRIGDGMSRVD